MNDNINWNKILKGFNVSTDWFVERDNKEIDLILAGTALPFVRGRRSGPYENCYPDEGGYCEDITAYNKETGEEIELTESEMDDANMILFEKYCDDHEPDFDEDSAYYGRDY